MVDEEGWNDYNRKEFNCHLLFDERSKVHEGIPEGAEDRIEEAVNAKKKVVINDATVIPERGP
jgi:hypothetical protein